MTPPPEVLWYVVTWRSDGRSELHGTAYHDPPEGPRDGEPSASCRAADRYDLVRRQMKHGAQPIRGPHLIQVELRRGTRPGKGAKLQPEVMARAWRSYRHTVRKRRRA